MWRTIYYICQANIVGQKGQCFPLRCQICTSVAHDLKFFRREKSALIVAALYLTFYVLWCWVHCKAAWKVFSVLQVGEEATISLTITKLLSHCESPEPLHSHMTWFRPSTASLHSSYIRCAQGWTGWWNDKPIWLFTFHFFTETFGSWWYQISKIFFSILWAL